MMQNQFQKNKINLRQIEKIKQNRMKTKIRMIRKKQKEKILLTISQNLNGIKRKARIKNLIKKGKMINQRKSKDPVQKRKTKEEEPKKIK